MAESNKVEVVISGISGIFPESDNVEELKELLFSKQNGITLDSRRWSLDEYGMTSGVGKVKNINKFDNVFFNMHRKLCKSSETVIRVNLERSVEAIIDAGLNPGDLYNTNTAVFACSSGGETDSIAMFDETKSGMTILGHNKAMQANRLSYVLNLNGPSFTLFSSFTGGLDALFLAKNMIEKGHIKTAIVGGCTLVQRPNLSLQLKGLGVLTDGIETRSFSDDAEGFNRAESCVSILLQNSLDAKRSYGTLVGVKVEQFGELRGVFTSYSTERFKEVIMGAYKEAGIDPSTVAYIEADGCGIKNVDAMELDIIKQVFCTPDRKEPLKVGSIKSNIGHTDAASCLVSLMKTIIAMDTGYIPPNINYNTPNSLTDAHKSRQLQIVTEKTPLNGDYVGINMFGRTGNYGHMILKKHNKLKKKIYAENEMFFDGLSRLIFISGRTEYGVKQSIKTIVSYNVDEEYVALLHSVFSKNIRGHFHRSYIILPTTDSSREIDVFSITNEKPPVWFVFSGMGSQWLGMGEQLLKIPIFNRAIEKCDAVLKPLGIDIFHILTSQECNLFDNILNSFVGISAIQIGLVDILRVLEIEPDGMIGHSVGELGCAYADGAFTAEEMILAAYARGRASVDTPLPDGMMAAIGLGYHSIKDLVPADVDVACHNSADSCTISGPTKSIMEFVGKLNSQKIFAKTVNVSNISFHSRYIKPAAPNLLQNLRKILPNPKKRSPRWLSTSIPESKWDTDLARYSSAEYHTNNLLNPVLFEETSVHIPKNAVVIEIAPHGLLQAVLKRSLSNMVNIPMTQRVYGNSIKYLLMAIGKMYCSGLNPKIDMLYNPISYPVSIGTPPIHTLNIWNHEEDWSTIDISILLSNVKGERLISLCPTKNSFIEEYEILGQHVLPLSALLFFTWQSFLRLCNENDDTDVSCLPVVFQDIHYHRHVVINKIETGQLRTEILKGTGHFELCLNNINVLSGNIFALNEYKSNQFGKKKDLNVPKEENDDGGNQLLVSLSHEEVYSTFEEFDFCVGKVFKAIKCVDIFQDELRSEMHWDKNWIHFLDAAFQLPTLFNIEKRGELVAPIWIEEIQIDPTAMAHLESEDILPVNYNIFTNEVTCIGVKISLPCFEILPLTTMSNTFQFREEGLIDLANPGFDKPLDFIDECIDIVLKFKYHDDFKNVFVCPVYNIRDDPSMNDYVEYILKTKCSNFELLDFSTHPENSNFNADNLQYVVLTRNEKFSHAISLMKNKNYVHMIVFSNCPITDKVDDYVMILQQKFGGNYLSLVKKISKVENFIIHRLSIENINCTTQFKNLLTELQSLNKMILIVSKIQPTEGILALVKKMDGIINIRFFFVLDDSAPTFRISDPFYSEQIAKDLLVNVYENGQWFTYKEIEFINYKDSQTPMNKIFLADFSNMSIKDVSVEYIGLSLQDTSTDMKKNTSTEYKLGPIEYSGLTSSGMSVMGISPFIPTVVDIPRDPILSWTIPKNISLEEASTIPVPYSMAYYMLADLIQIMETQCILVHAGLTAVGQACVDVSLERKCQVFVTVLNSKQMELFKQRFPSVPHTNIIIYDEENFEMKCLMANKRMDVIINCLNGEDFHASMRIMKQHGTFFQLSKTDMRKKYKMGLIRFLNDASFFSVSTERLIQETENTKKNIKNLIERRLQNGTIRSFDRCVITGACTGAQALEKLTKENILQKVVISTSKDKNFSSITGNTTRQFQCCPNKVYFVIGQGSDDWLYLVEWLVQRGAFKVVVVLVKYSLTPKMSHKFNMFMDRYKTINVQLVSQSLLNTEISAYNLIAVISTMQCPLAAVFFLSSVDEKTVENVKYAVSQVAPKCEQKPLFTCLFCGGAKLCEYLKSSGSVDALCLSWAQNEKKPKLTKILPLLDDLLLKSASLTNSVVICFKPMANLQTSIIN
ncbi:Hypothetical protein CINCED_3A015604 [Cinara cedri]|uniref:Ketosynthase family 3 (KS3) domain-containing protein n=1 Tax=Cinara cedri TaxID=506608 RepID=A0A5E4MIN8_9HEMI|nr:Hypothetical protein CINCED_3A015604 [Cinara cedri]